MKNQLQLWQGKIDTLDIRERGLLLLAILAVVYLLWDGLFQSRINTDERSIQVKVNAVQTQIQLLSAEQLSLTAVNGVDPDYARKNQVEVLRAEIAALDVVLSELSQGLVASENLPLILEDVLRNSHTLKLLKVQTLPVRELELMPAVEQFSSTPQDKNANHASSDLKAGVYKHSVHLTVEGSYFELLSYLQLLENLSWRFYWDALDYRVERYPKAVIEVRVYTLSAEEGLIGV